MPGMGQEDSWGQGATGEAPKEIRAARTALMKEPDRGSPGSIRKTEPESFK